MGPFDVFDFVSNFPTVFHSKFSSECSIFAQKGQNKKHRIDPINKRKRRFIQRFLTSPTPKLGPFDISDLVFNFYIKGQNRK